MKINGNANLKPHIEIVVIPRGGNDLVFKAQPVTDFDDFLKLCPMPLPPKIVRKGGAVGEDVEDANYKASIEVWATSRTDWMILKSLQATEGLEWETVNMSDCSTWTNYRKELETSGLTGIEVNRIIQAVVDACGLNQKKIDEATARFLAGQAALQKAL